VADGELVGGTPWTVGLDVGASACPQEVGELVGPPWAPVGHREGVAVGPPWAQVGHFEGVAVGPPWAQVGHREGVAVGPSP
jgi:hypothetical protein